MNTLCTYELMMTAYNKRTHYSYTLTCAKISQAFFFIITMDHIFPSADYIQSENERKYIHCFQFDGKKY